MEKWAYLFYRHSASENHFSCNVESKSVSIDQINDYIKSKYLIKHNYIPGAFEFDKSMKYNTEQMHLDLMDYFGSLGWEAFHVSDTGKYYFKKRIEQT